MMTAGLLILVAFTVYLLLGGIAGVRTRGRPDSDPDAPANLDPIVRGWRRRRSKQGKTDNWLTRPHVRFDGSGRGPLIQLFPKTTTPSSTDADQRESKGSDGD